MQLGTGAVPNAIGECLLEKRHPGCYTEMIPDECPAQATNICRRGSSGRGPACHAPYHVIAAPTAVVFG